MDANRRWQLKKLMARGIRDDLLSMPILELLQRLAELATFRKLNGAIIGKKKGERIVRSWLARYREEIMRDG